MKLSTTTVALFKCYSIEEGIYTAAETGFDALDLNLIHTIKEEPYSERNLEKTAIYLKNIAEKSGICFNQAHAPFPCVIFGDEAYNKATKIDIIRAIKIAGIVDAEQIVIHPIDCRQQAVNQKEYNLEFFNSLEPYCKEYRIKIALENMWGEDTNGTIVPNVCSFGKDLADYYNSLNCDYFTVCLDTGHAELLGQSCADAALELGTHLGALHVHDNDKISDAHTIPYQGKIDWEAFMRTLAKINYSGDLTFEVGGNFLNPYIDKPQIFKAIFSLLSATGREMIRNFKKYQLSDSQI